MKKNKYFFTIIGSILIVFLLGGFLFFTTLPQRNTSLPIISKLSNIESYLEKKSISFPITKDVHYYILDNSCVLIIDNRNPDFTFYIHSDVTAKLNNDGILTVKVNDTSAISETEISGTYGVRIQC